MRKILDFPSNPIIKVIDGGVYSTVVRPDGIIETFWFGDDGAETLIGSSSLAALAQKHIDTYATRTTS